ncbi:methyltransferase domain-containing protein [Candidatus Parcubacteria bacterium]|nr:methyltransferase domain-containing protein [Candidatus Parcubacteria bacterium]
MKMKLLKQIYYKIKCDKIIKKHANYKREKYEDRNVLESIIFPYMLAYHNPETVLDIGREGNQKFYNDFFSNRELWTIDLNPKHREFGAKNHVTDDVVNIKKHFKNNYFDFILMNGVFGWGLDDEKKIQTAFDGIYKILKPNGIFILGYNDEIFPFKKINGLNKLKKYKFEPLKNSSFKCINGNHTYDFYIKK